MNTRTALRKSQLIAPAEAALNRASNQQELEDAWYDYTSGFADESVERAHLLQIYMARVKVFKAAEDAAKMLRV